MSQHDSSCACSICQHNARQHVLDKLLEDNADLRLALAVHSGAREPFGLSEAEHASIKRALELAKEPR